MPDSQNELRQLKNVGPATCEDFAVLGISTIAELAQADADELYLHLIKLTGQHHDPCVWDVFAATIHEAQTGEKLPWWHWTPVRKARQAAGTFCL